MISASEYWNSIDFIEANEVKLQLTVHDYPHLKDDARKAIFKTFDNKTKDVRKSNGKKLSNKELLDILSRR